mgnify:CR=1 FL=1
MPVCTSKGGLSCRVLPKAAAVAAVLRIVPSMPSRACYRWAVLLEWLRPVLDMTARVYACILAQRSAVATEPCAFLLCAAAAALLLLYAEGGGVVVREGRCMLLCGRLCLCESERAAANLLAALWRSLQAAQGGDETLHSADGSRRGCHTYASKESVQHAQHCPHKL